MRFWVLTIPLLLVAVPDAFAGDEIRSDYGYGQYVCDVTSAALEKAPKWQLQETPPLAMLDAVSKARNRIGELRADDTSFTWSLHRVELIRSRNDRHWYYVITFRGDWVLKNVINPDEYKPESPPKIRIPVLLDGSIPKIVDRKHSVRLLEILDDLNL